MTDELQAIPPQSRPTESPEQWANLPPGVQEKMNQLMAEAKSAKEARRLEAEKSRQTQEALQQILEATDGTSVQEAINKIKEKEAQRLELEKQQRALKDMQAAAQNELKLQYQKQVDDLQKQLEESAAIRAKELQQQSLYREFVKNNGINFEYFNTLLEVEFAPVYEDNKLVAINKKDGTAIFLDDSTKPASVSEVLVAMQKGQFGQIFPHLFQAYNRTSGANVPGGHSSGTRVVTPRKTSTGVPVIGREEANAMLEKRFVS
jgi:flagellar motor protein MotB